MKKLLFLAAIAMFVTGVNAQEGAFAGGHFAYNSTWLMNPQVFDDGAGQNPDVSWGYYYGLVLGYNFKDNMGVEVDFNVNKLTQKYDGEIDVWLTDDEAGYKSHTTMNTFDIPVMMKFGENSYFELGPLFHIVNKVNYTRDFNNDDEIGDVGVYKDLFYLCRNDERNVAEEFNSFGFGVAMGFGSDIPLVNDALYLNFGVRFNYILTDLGGVNGLGFNIDGYDGYHNNTDFVPEDNQDDENEKDRFHTNPLYGGFKIGLKYRFN
ncbi:MAG: outer membrane beta-barrel protein [Bacteroidales bacterium]|nr:outer membrane beta-barrel protein [Bacteroidales bacterium]HOY38365.1 outer membrane beta-barrel protein [Bacteroidales bacterium]HQP04428.1 outer membrane beta-barrel protein [Bacteroidales bacterium]